MKGSCITLARWFPLGVVMVLATMLLVGCGSSGGAASVASLGSGQSTSSASTDAATAWHQFAVCARAHGVPNLPDPVIDANGQPQFPGFSVQSVAPAVQQQVTNACGSEIQAALGTQKPPTQAEIQARVNFAHCMRQHGVASFPDPDPLTGQFPVGPRPTDQAFNAGRQACISLLPQGAG